MGSVYKLNEIIVLYISVVYIQNLVKKMNYRLF